MTGPYITEAGGRAATEMFGDGGRERVEENANRWVTRVDESWAGILTGFVINGMYARDVLPTSTRELCAVAALTALGRADELKAHLRIALNSNPPEHVREVILQMAVYSGVPAALEGMRHFEAVMAEDQ
jgi:3-oxoadipate enol-lactonase/4-carboxymuconolactone decarboxylase